MKKLSVKKKPRKHPKKNNAHIIQKDKLVLGMYNLEMELFYGKRAVKQLPIRLY